MLARNKPSKEIIDAFKVLLNNECVELDLTIFNNDGQTVTDIALDKGDLISESTYFHFGTGKSMSEALIFASINPQFDNRLFIELPIQYMKIPSSEHIVYTSFCFDIQNNLCTQHVVNCSSEPNVCLYL